MFNFLQRFKKRPDSAPPELPSKKLTVPDVTPEYLDHMRRYGFYVTVQNGKTIVVADAETLNRLNRRSDTQLVDVPRAKRPWFS